MTKAFPHRGWSIVEIENVIEINSPLGMKYCRINYKSAEPIPRRG